MRDIPILYPLLTLAAFLVFPEMAAGQSCSVSEVSRDELLDAMRLHGDYDIVPTTNWSRFQTEVFLRLAHEARERSPDGDPLFIRADDWFFGYLEVAGLDPDEAPEPTLKARELGQNMQIDYRYDRVVEQVIEGPEPVMALNVRIWWPEGPGSPSSYSWEDTLSTPELKVTSHRMITYRLLEFDDMVVYDQIRGISGRPTSGLLGLVFSVIGQASVKQSRMSFSEDGTQVVRSRSKKLFSVTVTATVRPDGTAIKGILPTRRDLERIEARLKHPLEVDYVPYAC